MSEDYMKFIREFRRSTGGLEIKEIAQRMRVTPAAVHGWFAGTSRMNPESMIRAIWAFGIDMRLLFNSKWGTFKEA